ncbi:MAG TPA: hypothetical protein VMY59_00580, partial [Candidatus Thermoplasmatota archaeon]|nr:hypothetical protein [Candidatus Thermoplasmatota archaeon]
MEKKWLNSSLVLAIVVLMFGTGITPILMNGNVLANENDLGFEVSNICGCIDTNIDSKTPSLFDENNIYYYNSVAYACLGWSADDTIERAIRLTPTELSGYSGGSLVAGRFYHCETNSRTLTLKVYGQGTATNPGSLIAQQSATASGQGWVRIDLASPITLNINQDYWISFEIFNVAGEYPAGIDEGPAVDGKGDWLYHPDYGWYELQYQSTPIDANYNIEAIVSGGGSPPPFNPPEWMSVLIDLTGANPTWTGSYWYVQIPFNTNYIPEIDSSVYNAPVPWPLGGDYLSYGGYSCDINVKNYPNNLGSGTWEIDTTIKSSNFRVTIPIVPKFVWAKSMVSFSCTNEQWFKHLWFWEGDLSIGFEIGNPMPFWLGPIPITIKFKAEYAGGYRAEIISPAYWEI